MGAVPSPPRVLLTMAPYGFSRMDRGSSEVRDLARMAPASIDARSAATACSRVTRGWP